MPEKIINDQQPADSAVASPEIIDKIVRLLCNIQDRASIVGACLNKLGIAPADVDAAIDAAKTKLTRASDYHRDHELGKALTRLNECYQRAVGVQDTKTALAAQREINKLLDLYPAYEPPGDDEEADPAADLEERREIESQELADMVGAIEAYIEPLKLSEDVNDTDSDLIRLAGTEIKRLRRKRKKTGTTKIAKTTKKKGVRDGQKKNRR